MSWEEKISRGVLAMADANYVRAESDFEAALEEARSRSSGADDERVMQSLSFLGEAYYKIGRFDLAAECIEQTLSKQKNELNAAVAHLCLAKVITEPAQAAKHLQQAVGVLKKRKKEAVSCAIEASDELGKLFKAAAAKDTDCVQRNFRSLLNKAQRQYQDHSDSQGYFGPAPDRKLAEWEELMMSGTTMLTQETSAHWVRAYEEISQALRIAQQIFQMDHPNMATNLLALAEAAMKLGFSDEACNYLALSMKICDQQDPPDIHKLALVKLSIAGLHTEVYDYNQAMRYLAEAVDLLGQSGMLRQSDDSSLLMSFSSLMQQAQLFCSAHELVSQAIELEENEHLEQANYCYDNSLILLEQVFTEDSLEIAQILRFKTAVLRKLGRNKEAKTTDTRANQIEEEITEKYRALERFRQSLPQVILNPARK